MVAPVEMVVAFPQGRGVQWWAERNAAGPVPGRWPYGLDRLQPDDVTDQGAPAPPVKAVEVAGLGRGARLIGRVAGLGVLTADGSPGRVGLCWSESLAPALLHQVQAERRFAGVIWATDQVASDDRSPQVRLIRKALLRLDGLWVLSRPQVAAVQSWLGPGCPPVHAVQFGVDPAFYRGVPYPADPMLISIGGDRDRDPETLFAALEIILDRRPGLKVVVQSRSTRAAPPGVRKEAFIPHDEVRRLYAQASVVALATRPNLHGSGMTVSLEAMSVGRPVVATRTPGMEDYVVDGHTGYLVDPGDSTQLAAKVLQLLDDPTAAAAMGERSRSRVLDRHTTDTMCAQLRDLCTLT